MINKLPTLARRAAEPYAFVGIRDMDQVVFANVDGMQQAFLVEFALASYLTAS